MPKTLLHVDSSLSGAASVTRQLTAEFVGSWRKANPDGVVIDRDTSTSNIPPVDGAWAGAIYTPEEARTPEQKALLTLSDTLIGELEAADEYVLGVPMYNFSIPSTLKLWIDQIARVNKTFSYATGTPVGLLKGKKATVVIASGGKYDTGTAMASFNHAEPYLRTVLGFLGVQDVTFVLAGGAAALRGGADRTAFLQPFVESIRAQFAAA
ncbi:MAG: NAD(P)H-dependent oxidoreductase [Acidobacteriota bacterium]